jgi:hypothetical protein
MSLLTEENLKERHTEQDRKMDELIERSQLLGSMLKQVEAAIAAQPPSESSRPNTGQPPATPLKAPSEASRQPSQATGSRCGTQQSVASSMRPPLPAMMGGSPSSAGSQMSALNGHLPRRRGSSSSEALGDLASRASTPRSTLAVLPETGPDHWTAPVEQVPYTGTETATAGIHRMRKNADARAARTTIELG